MLMQHDYEFKFHIFLDVIFEPCLHQSCHSCIIQHLMSVKLCFYCKAFITLVKKTDGTVLYTNESSPSSRTDSMNIEVTSTSNRDTQTLEDIDIDTNN